MRHIEVTDPIVPKREDTMISWLKAEEQHQHKNGGGWVANTATVEATAYIGPDARVYGEAWVSGEARVYGDAQVYGNALVSGDAWVSGDALVFGNAKVYDNARVSGNAKVYGNAWETSPLYIQGSKHSVTNCAYGSIAIGCQVHTFAEWKRHYKAIGKAQNYTAAQIKEYGLLIALVTKLGN